MIRASIDGQTENARIYWTKQYLLGLISETDEVLASLQWRRHRTVQKQPSDPNVALEIVDLFKYVLSLAELWDLTPEQLLQLALEKGEILRTMWNQEHATLPAGMDVLVCDLDGTLADWRSSFLSWCKENYPNHLWPETDPCTSLHCDLDWNLPYSVYSELEIQFERSGGYARLQPFPENIATVRRLQQETDFLVVFFTARPVNRNRKIWWDTYRWLLEQGLRVDMLRIGNESRLLFVNTGEWGARVLLEDNPTLAIRAAKLGIKVFLLDNNYNSDVHHENIIRVDSLDESVFHRIKEMGHGENN